MKEVKIDRTEVGRVSFYLRKLSRSGGSRYLSVGTFLPDDWEAVKVYLDKLDSQGCTLRIIPIR